MKKRTMEKEHQAEERRKKVLMEIAGTVVVLTVIVSIGLSHLGTDKVNTSAGVKAIKKLEKADVSEVETKISNIEKEEKQATEDWQNRPLSEKFAHAVILGDSITTGFTVYDVLDTSKVVVMKDIDLFSYCEHHMALMYDMKATVAYIPNGKVIGLSKIARICDMVGRRLQLQERIGQDIADIMTEITGSEDVAVVLEGYHSCVSARGIKKNNTRTMTVELRGSFKDDAALQMYLR